MIEFGADVFGLEVDPRARAREDWGIKGHEGRMQSVGVEGAVTGKGADLVIIDDPVKNDKDAMSELKRNNAREWYRSTLRTRLEPGANIIILQTRWHEDDLSGWLMEEATKGNGEDFEIINFPAIAEENDALGRKPGEALCPDRFDELALSIIRKALGSKWFTALYQQKPRLDSGNIFKRHLFTYYNRAGGEILFDGRSIPISNLRRFATVDLAFTEKQQANDPDWTVIAVWGTDGEHLFLLDLIRFQEEVFDTVPGLRRAYAKWKLSEIYIETNGFGSKIINAARKGIHGKAMRIKEVTADRDKVTRALAAYPYFEDGTIIFPLDAVWLGELEKELLSFPKARHDDQVDAIAYGPLVGGVGVVRPFDVAGRSPSTVLESMRTKRPA